MRSAQNTIITILTFYCVQRRIQFITILTFYCAQFRISLYIFHCMWKEIARIWWWRQWKKRWFIKLQAIEKLI